MKYLTLLHSFRHCAACYSVKINSIYANKIVFRREKKNNKGHVDEIEWKKLSITTRNNQFFWVIFLFPSTQLKNFQLKQNKPWKYKPNNGDLIQLNSYFVRFIKFSLIGCYHNQFSVVFRALVQSIADQSDFLCRIYMKNELINAAEGRIDSDDDYKPLIKKYQQRFCGEKKKLFKTKKFPLNDGRITVANGNAISSIISTRKMFYSVSRTMKFYFRLSVSSVSFTSDVAKKVLFLDFFLCELCKLRRLMWATDLRFNPKINLRWMFW